MLASFVPSVYGAVFVVFPALRDQICGSRPHLLETPTVCRLIPRNLVTYTVRGRGLSENRAIIINYIGSPLGNHRFLD